MKKRLALLCACSALPLAICQTALADEVGNWYVTPSFGGVSVANDRPLLEDKDWLYGFAIGKHLSPNWSLELNATGAQVGGQTLSDSDLSLWGQSLDLLRVFGRDHVFAPYVSVGAGAQENEFSPGSNATDFMYQAGVGAFIKLYENSSGSFALSLRPDMKARWDDAGAPGTYTDYLATLGFQISFGPKKSAPEPAPLPVQSAPAPAPVAEPTPPPPPPPPGDADKDGVTDDIDQCPNTPLGTAVDAKGCPLKAKDSIVIEGVTFDVNSSRLTMQSQPILNEVADGLRKHPRLRVELQGHTDDTGPDAYNLTLSKKRADAVREYLLTQGVPSTQLTAKGYGESQPLDNNKTPEGRAKNRRVVMYVLENPGDVKIEGEGKVQ
jgi:OOP family OmpA-OmpF porin